MRAHLAGIAATQQGLERVVQAVNLHNLQWGWLLNVPESIVMVFGTQSVCARPGAPELWWGNSRLPAADIVQSCGSAFSRAGAESLCRWLALLTDGQRYISGCQFYAASI